MDLVPCDEGLQSLKKGALNFSFERCGERGREELCNWEGDCLIGQLTPLAHVTQPHFRAVSQDP